MQRDVPDHAAGVRDPGIDPSAGGDERSEVVDERVRVAVGPLHLARHSTQASMSASTRGLITADDPTDLRRGRACQTRRCVGDMSDTGVAGHP